MSKPDLPQRLRASTDQGRAILLMVKPPKVKLTSKELDRMGAVIAAHMDDHACKVLADYQQNQRQEEIKP